MLRAVSNAGVVLSYTLIGTFSGIGIGLKTGFAIAGYKISTYSELSSEFVLNHPLAYLEASHQDFINFNYKPEQALLYAPQYGAILGGILGAVGGFRYGMEQIKNPEEKVSVREMSMFNRRVAPIAAPSSESSLRM